MTTRLANNHDTILAYAKSKSPTWNGDTLFQPYDAENLDEKTSQSTNTGAPRGGVSSSTT
jgi:hypothetical protein